MVVILGNVTLCSVIWKYWLWTFRFVRWLAISLSSTLVSIKTLPVFMRRSRDIFRIKHTHLSQILARHGYSFSNKACLNNWVAWRTLFSCLYVPSDGSCFYIMFCLLNSLCIRWSISITFRLTANLNENVPFHILVPFRRTPTWLKVRSNTSPNKLMYY